MIIAFYQFDTFSLHKGMHLQNVITFWWRSPPTLTSSVMLEPIAEYLCINTHRSLTLLILLLKYLAANSFLVIHARLGR